MNDCFTDGRRFRRVTRSGRLPGWEENARIGWIREQEPTGGISMVKSLLGGIVAATAFVMLGSTAMAEPEVVSGPAAEPECFAPWSADTKFFKFPRSEE